MKLHFYQIKLEAAGPRKMAACPTECRVKKITEQAVFRLRRKGASPDGDRDLSLWYLRIKRVYGAISLAIGLRSNF